MNRLATLSLDLDNKWSYLKTHGDSGWESLPSYLDLVVPRILDFLRQRNLTITFFIVGQDASLEKNQQALRCIAEAGHEIGNHSFNHEPWLHLYSEQEIETELARAEEHIERVTGQRPVGFRGPGYSLSSATLRVLARRGYEYDATTFPNLLNPLARLYYFMSSNLSQEERRQRKALFGTLRDALSPVRPYQWRMDEGTLTEIPVTTMPIFKLPIHFTYLLWLSTINHSLAILYFRSALRFCRWTSTPPSLLLHPLDFMGCDDDQDLDFFPGMKIPTQKKIMLLDSFLRLLTSQYQVVTMKYYATELAKRNDLRVLEPIFRHTQ